MMKKKGGPNVFPGTLDPTVVGYRSQDNYIIDTIFEVISRYNGVGRIELKSKNRKKKIKNARQIFHFLARKYTKESFSEIGNHTDNDHSTVIYSVKIVEDVMTYNKDLIYKIGVLCNEIDAVMLEKKNKTIISNED